MKRLKETKPPTDAEVVAADELEEGMEVEHHRFGKGRIVTISGSAPDTKATIFFPSSGKKVLLLRFAKLRILS